MSMFGMEVYSIESHDKISCEYFETFEEAKSAADIANSDEVRIYVYESGDDSGMYWDDTKVVYEL